MKKVNSNLYPIASGVCYNEVMANMEYFWKKRRLVYFLMALLVIFVHNSAVEQYSSLSGDLWMDIAELMKNFFAYGIGSVAVPMFFIISGMTFFRDYEPKKYGQKMKSRIKTLVIPYLVWNVLGMVFVILCTYTPIRNIVSSREMFSFSLQNILEGIFLYKYNYTFWFMFELIIFVLVTPIFDIITRNKWIGWAATLASLPLVMVNMQVNLGFVTFYLIGCMLGRHYLPLMAKKLSQSQSSVGLIGVILLTTIKMLSIYGVIILPEVIQQIILILLCAGVWMMADMIVDRIKPRKIMDETFLIYAIHPYLIAAITKIIYLVLPKIPAMAVVNFSMSYVLTVVVTGAVIVGWRRVHLRFKSA